MYNKLLIDSRYSFKTEDDVRFNDGPIPLSELGDTLDIQVDGISHRLCRRWLSLIAHFEIDLPIADCRRIRFIPCDSGLFKYRKGVKCVSSSPIVSRSGFRVVPGYSRYEVSKSGVVVSRKSGKTLSVRQGPYGYPVVGVYDPDKKRHRDIALHILVASTWVVNKDPHENHVVNHIDGDKTNFGVSNLEWTSGSDNNVHARDTGLKDDSLRCHVFDTMDGSLVEYPSISEAFVSVGLSRCAKRTTENVGGVIRPRLFKGRFFINRPDSGIRNEDLNLFVTSQRIANSGPYQVIDATGIVTEFKSINDIAKELCIPMWGLHEALISGPTREYLGYRVRSSSEEPWPDAIRPSVDNTPRGITASKESVTKEFRSIREAHLHFNCDKTTITNRVSGKITRPWNGWSFRSSEK